MPLTWLVRVTEQLPDTRLHVDALNVPRLVVHVIVPVGVLVVPVAVSLTVAVHSEPWLATTGVAQDTPVEVVLRLTVKVSNPWLVAWTPSPPL